MKIRAKTVALSAALAVLGAAALPAGAQSVGGLPSAPTEIASVEHVRNLVHTSANSMAFFARTQPDGTERRYVVVATVGNGFDIVEVTDPENPMVVGRYLLGEDPAEDPQGALMRSSLGHNFHPWVDVNPVRNIVSLTIEDPAGSALRHNGGQGIIFVDISDVTNPRPLGSVPNNSLGGPHTNKMIGDHCVYTSIPTWLVNYSDPMNPTAKQIAGFDGHEFFEDPNIPNRTYMGDRVTGRWGILDTTDCWNPVFISKMNDAASLGTAHEVYPAPDSSFVGVADFTSAGQLQTQCPGGAVHFYDISGKYVPGASVESPRKMDARYFAPFTGLPLQGSTNYGSCTMHSLRPDLERMLGLAGLYMGGTYVFDWSGPTQPGGIVPEYDGARGTTTWGNTKGLVRDAADYVNAAQWLPFDLTDPAHERLFYVAGQGRGLDVYRYTGPLPKKLARLQVDASASGGVVSGSLDRYARLTAAGYENFPLPEELVEISAGGVTAQVLTELDGSFSADLGLAAGTHQVTVTWSGDDTYRGETTTATVTV